MKIWVFDTVQEMAEAAAEQASAILREAVERNGRARVVVATGNSQIAFIDALVRRDVPWNAVEIFHMDEYAGVGDEHPASFRRWIRMRVTDRVHPAAANYLDGLAPDVAAECARYSELLNAAPIDLAFVGIGENGHIAFNDPHEADFKDPATVKVVTLDEACRAQQTGEGHFATADDVPARALTMTCPALMRARHLVCCVPDARKAKAVQCAVEGPLTPACPASLLREHPSASLYLDRESASLLSGRS